ncbi:MAG: hypothetical protein AAB434_11275, partial [Planctomycetota bacterium]
MGDPREDPVPLPPAHETLPMAQDDRATLPTGQQAGLASPPSPPVRLAPNLPRRLGPYELLDELGQGGQGLVFRARHEKLGTVVALKVLIAGE